MANLICDHCGAQMVKKEGKNFYVCPAWRKDGSGCEGGIKFPSKEKGKQEGTKRIIDEADQGELILKKLDQILFLLTGTTQKEEEAFKEIMKNELNRGLLKRITK